MLELYYPHDTWSIQISGSISHLLKLRRQALSLACLTDEIDAIAGKRESAQREMERRIVAQMLTCMDDLAAPRPAKRPKSGEESPSDNADRHVLVIGEA